MDAEGWCRSSSVQSVLDNGYSTPRDLAGLCIYQHYLKHLHRLHHSYILKHRAMKQQGLVQEFPKKTTVLSRCNPQNSPSHSAAPGYLPPQLKHRSTVTKDQQSTPQRIAQAQNISKPKTAPHSTIFPQIPDKRTQMMGNVNTIFTKVRGKLSQHEPVHIPCGREHSEIWMLKLKMRIQRQRERDGAWSFRTWKTQQGLSKTLYSS